MIDYTKAKQMVADATDEFIQSDLFGWTLDIKDGPIHIGDATHLYFTDEAYREKVIAEYKFWNKT